MIQDDVKMFGPGKGERGYACRQKVKEKHTKWLELDRI